MSPLSWEVLAEGILHEHRVVRETCFDYFAHAYSRNPAIAAKVIRSAEKYGRDQAFRSYYNLSKLVIDDATAQWVLNNVGDIDEGGRSVGLEHVLTTVPSGILARHESDIERIEEFDPDTAVRLRRRIKFRPLSVGDLWNEYERFVHELVRKKVVDIDMDLESDLVQALTERSDEESAQRVREALAKPHEPEPEEASLEFMETTSVLLAGHYRLTDCVPAILDRIRDCLEYNDVLFESSEEALLRIGSPETVAFICRCISSFEEARRGTLIYVLEHMQCEGVEEALLELLPKEKDPEMADWLTIGLAKRFSERGFEAAYPRCVEYSDNKELGFARETLAVYGVLSGLEFPEREAWLASGIAWREKLSEFDEGFEEEEGFSADEYESMTFVPGTIRKEEAKVGRNDPCPCGSGKKFKKCCLRASADI